MLRQKVLLGDVFPEIIKLYFNFSGLNRQAFNDIEAEQNFVITPTSDDFLISEDIRVCNLEQFLLLLSTL